MRSRTPTAEPAAHAAFPVMGTFADLAVWGDDASGALAAAHKELDRLDALWSRFRPGSDVSRLNAAPGEWVQVDPATASLIRRAARFAHDTGGSFDATVGTGRGQQPRVRDDAVRLPDGARLDLGGIGKGAAADRVVRLLGARGMTTALVNLGRSSIGVLGLPPGRDSWRIEIHQPGGPATGHRLALSMRSGFLSTSGDYEASSAAGNHIVDPATGRPAHSGVSSATVIAGDGARAEALSTALLVLGTANGLALRARLGGFDAVLLDTADGVCSTPGLAG